MSLSQKLMLALGAGALAVTAFVCGNQEKGSHPVKVAGIEEGARLENIIAMICPGTMGTIDTSLFEGSYLESKNMMLLGDADRDTFLLAGVDTKRQSGFAIRLTQKTVEGRPPIEEEIGALALQMRQQDFDRILVLNFSEKPLTDLAKRIQKHVDRNYSGKTKVIAGNYTSSRPENCDKPIFKGPSDTHSEDVVFYFQRDENGYLGARANNHPETIQEVRKRSWNAFPCPINLLDLGRSQ